MRRCASCAGCNEIVACIFMKTLHMHSSMPTLYWLDYKNNIICSYAPYLHTDMMEQRAFFDEILSPSMR